MVHALRTITAAALLWRCVAWADSVVVFNEIMYHPGASDEAAFEWVELRNQMSVDIDISRWRLDRAVQFTFPEGTVIPGGGFLVVASAPATLAGLGVTNLYGPYTGRLGNGGDTLELRNNNDRVMDEVAYGTGAEWPVAPDGAGPSLAKRAVNLASADPASWRMSAQAGGTPGRDNFPVTPPTVVSNTLVALDATWNFNDTGADLGDGWRATGFDDSGWPSGPGLFYHTDAPLPGPKGTRLATAPTTCYFRSRFVFAGETGRVRLQLQPMVDDGAVVYLNGVEVCRVNMPAGPVTHSTLASASVGEATLGEPVDVPLDSLVTGTNVLAVEVHQGGLLTAYPQAVLNSAPVGYWRLGETSSPALDWASAAEAPQSGAQNGAYHDFMAANLGQAGPRPSDSVEDRALEGFGAGNTAPRFAGDNDDGNDVVIIPDPGALSFNGAPQFTLEAWVNGGASQEAGAAIIAKGTGAGGEQYCLDVYGGVYRFFVRDSGTAASVLSTATGPDNTWQHVVCVYDQPAGLMRVYVNGVAAGSGTPPPTLLNTAHKVTLGARQLSAGPYDLNFDGRIDEVAIYNRALPTNEISAHFNAAFDSGVGSGPDTNDVVFGLQLASLETLPSTESSQLLFNEIAAATNTDFWLELINRGPTQAELGGCIVAWIGGLTNREYVLPPGTLGPGAFRQITRAELGFSADPGDRLVLYAAGGANVLDAVVVAGEPRGRHPDGADNWWVSTHPTPGGSNVFALRDELVINEIMFHPRDLPGPPRTPSPESWIEIFNRSTNQVDLTGWRLGGGIEFEFPSHQFIAPGGYVVVAKDVGYMRLLHPGLEWIGPFASKLGRNGDLLILRDPAGNPACTVQYFDGGRWPEYADGGGSSLELRDPRADTTAAEAWAASDERGKSAWETFTWRGIAAPGQPGEPTLWHEFAMCLVDGAGEALLDDVSVIETPGTNPKQLIQNGRFDGGSAAHWRFLGTHRHSRAEAEPGNAGNGVLHLVATGAGEYQGNQVETTLAGNTAIRDGIEYEISFRAKWLAGKSLLNSRLYFNRLARTVQLAVPSTNGTPGRVNSRFVANLGPTFSSLAHEPVVPKAFEAVSVSVKTSDPDGIAAMSLNYAVNGGVWLSVPMTFTSGGRAQQATGTIPGQASGSIVQFYVQAADTLGAAATFPASGTNSRALYVVQDGQAVIGPLHNFRLIMTRADAIFLHTDTNTLSNELLGGTVVYDEREVFYDVGVRLKGSFVGRNVPRVGFHVLFQPDRLFQGVHGKVGVDRSQHTLTGGVGEILVKHLAGHAGGIPNMYDDLAHFIAPLPAYTSIAALRLAGFDDLYLDSQFLDGNDGPMHEPEVIRWMLSTVDGHPESTKLPGNEGAGTGWIGYDLQDYGDNAESYRWTFPLVNNRTADDLSGPMAVCKLFSLTGAAFETGSRQVLDVDEWLRVLAFQELSGVTDAYYTGGTFHNYRLYRRPGDGKVLYLPWDWDSCFTAPPTAAIIGGYNVTRLLDPIANYRAYLNHLYDLIATTCNSAYAARWTAHYGALSGQDFSGVLNYIGARAGFVMGQLPTAAGFAINSQAMLANGIAALAGTAPISVNQIEVNGVSYPVTWTSTTNWTVTLPLGAGANTLAVRGLDQQGNGIPGADGLVVVTNLGPGALQAVVINEWMADNKGPGGFPNPVNGSFSDWFELFNPNTNAVNLSGMFLTDRLTQPTKWQIPTNVFISGRGFLLVWADNNTNQNPVLGGTNVALHANFQLDKDGEALGLFAADGITPLSTVTFGPQLQNVSQGRFPDGNTNTSLSMPNWSPQATNTLAALSQPRIQSIEPASGLVTLVCEVMPGRTYQLQFKTVLSEPSWSLAPLATAVRATGESLTLNDVPNGSVTHRFYRLVLVP